MDRNFELFPRDAGGAPSLSARRAWIEIRRWLLLRRFWRVALRKESVDRNCICAARRSRRSVALRKESVDRNIFFTEVHKMDAVALRKESVDRNYIIKITGNTPTGRSPQGERG